MASHIALSQVASSYLQNSPLGYKAQNAGAEDKNINDIIDEKISATDKTRYMDANTPTIQAIKLSFEAGTVGVKTDVQFKFKKADGTLDKEKNDLAEKDWNLFKKKEFFDASGNYHCDNTLRQIVKAEKGTEGEALLLHIYNPSWKFKYKVKLLETSMIDISKDREAELYKSGKNKGKIKVNAIISGLELGEYGETVAIYIFDNETLKETSTRYTKEQFTLYFDPHLRISQHRGITQLSGVIGTIQDTITYKETELRTAEKTASTQFVHKTPLIKPLIVAQQNYWEAKARTSGGSLSVHDFGTEDQSNSPTAYIGQDEELNVLNKGDRKSMYSTFLENLDNTLAQNFNLSNNSLLKGDGNAVFAVVKAQKQENETRFGIIQDNLKEMLFEDIINNFITYNHKRWGIRDFYTNKYEYLYKFKITIGTKTELDEYKSAKAREINLKTNTIDKYMASQEKGNDYDAILEANTRANLKQAEELSKVIERVIELNVSAEKIGIRYTVSASGDIILDENFNSTNNGGE